MVGAEIIDQCLAIGDQEEIQRKSTYVNFSELNYEPMSKHSEAYILQAGHVIDVINTSQVNQTGDTYVYCKLYLCFLLNYSILIPIILIAYVFHLTPMVMVYILHSQFSILVVFCGVYYIPKFYSPFQLVLCYLLYLYSY